MTEIYAIYSHAETCSTKTEQQKYKVREDEIELYRDLETKEYIIE